MERARSGALDVLRSVRADGQYQVMAVNTKATLLTQPTSDAGALRAAVQSIKAGDFRSSYAEFARTLRATASASGLPVEAHFFTDVQRTALPAGFGELTLGPNTSLQVHAVADKRQPNWTVETVSAPRRLFVPEKARIEATIAGYGTEKARRKVSLVVDGKVRETKEVDVDAGGRATVEFLKLDVPYGFNRCEIRLDGADALPADDHFFFSVERSDPKKILFVHDGRKDRSLLYLSAALDSADEPAFTVEGSRLDLAPPQHLDSYVFVVLDDPGTISEGWVGTLDQYVRAGGSLWITLGPAAAARGRVPVWGNVIDGSHNSLRAGERFQTLGQADETHPSLRKTNRWEGVKFYQTAVVRPGDANVVARLSDNTPIIMEKRLGEGRLLLFASTLDNISNDFPLHPAFVPFVDQTAKYLAGEAANPANYVVGNFLELRRETGKAEAVEVLGPDGERMLSLEEALRSQSLPLERAGYYEVKRSGGRQELVAVNTDRAESDLALVPAETLALWQGGNAGTKAVANTDSRREAWSFWWWILLAVLGVGVVESLFARRYLSPEAVGDEDLSEEAA